MVPQREVVTLSYAGNQHQEIIVEGYAKSPERNFLHDLIISVQKQEFSVNSLVIATHSSVFRSLLEESRTRRMRLNQVEAEDFGYILQYIHTGLEEPFKILRWTSSAVSLGIDGVGVQCASFCYKLKETFAEVAENYDHESFCSEECYQKSFIRMYHDLKNKAFLDDFIVVCSDKKQVRAKKFILATFSGRFLQYFERHVGTKKAKTSLSGEQMMMVLEFIETGNICMPTTKLESFLKAARHLKIRGIRTEESLEIESGKNSFETVGKQESTNNNDIKGTNVAKANDTIFEEYLDSVISNIVWTGKIRQIMDEIIEKSILESKVREIILGLANKALE